MMKPFASRMINTRAPGGVAAGIMLAALIPAIVEGADKVPGDIPHILYPNTTVNGQPVTMMLDTGSSFTYLRESEARRLGLSISALNNVKVNLNADMSITEPAKITFGAQSCLVRLSVDLLEGDLPAAPGAPGANAGHDAGGSISWREVRDNILFFNGAERTLTSVVALPPETANWQKLKLVHDNVLALETPMPNGQTGTILVDTGAQFGVGLPAAQWQQWRAAHPAAAISTEFISEVGKGDWAVEEAWADEIQLGAITLHDVMIHECKQRFTGELGLEALQRMDLVVDWKEGHAYIRPRPPQASVDRTNGPAKGTGPDINWKAADNLRINTDRLLATSLIFLADSARASKDYAAAEAGYTKALALDPQDAEAFTKRGWAKGNLKDYAGAIADFTSSLALDPTVPEVFADRGLTRKLLGDFDGAVADYGRALELDQKNLPALMRRAEANLLRSQPAASKADCDRALALNAKSDWLHLLRGMARQSLGDLAGALDDYDGYVALNPGADYPQLYRQLIRLRLGLPSDDFAKTVAAWKPGWVKLLGQFIDGDQNEAAVLKAADEDKTQASPTIHGEAFYIIGAMRMVKGDKAGAAINWQKCLMVGPPGLLESALARSELLRLAEAPPQ